MHCTPTCYASSLIWVVLAAACGGDSFSEIVPTGGDGGPEANVEGSVGAETGPAAECIVRDQRAGRRRPGAVKHWGVRERR